MKRSMVSKVASVLLVATSMTIIGCGSSGDDSATATDQTVTGSAVDGYIKEATVCLDLNKNNVCDIATEPSDQTDTNGSFTLTLTPEQQTSDAPLLVIGGIDVDTNTKLLGTLKAPLSTGSDVNITPITSMVQAMVAKGTSKAEAEAQVAKALGISAEHVNADPVEISTTNPEVAKAAIKILRTVEMLANANATTLGTNDIDNIFNDLAAGVKTVADDDTLSGISGIVKAVEQDSNNIDADLFVAVTKIETDIDSAFERETDLTKAALLADAIATAVEKIVADILNDAAKTFDNDFDTDYIFDLTTVNFTETAVYNLFDTYDVENITDGIITEIASKFTDPKSVTVDAINSLTNLSTEAQAAVNLLKTAYTIDQDKLKTENVEIYLENLGVEDVADSVISDIASLSDYSDTMTKDEFVLMLRASGNTALSAFADSIDPQVPVDSLKIGDYSELSVFMIENNYGGDVIVEGEATFDYNSGLAQWSEKAYDMQTKTWVNRDNNDYILVNGEWTLDDGVNEPISISADGIVLTDMWGEHKIDSVVSLAGLTRTYSTSYGDVNVAFGEGDVEYKLLVKDSERYELWNKASNYQSDISYAKIEDYIKSSPIHWYLIPNTTDRYGNISVELDDSNNVIGLGDNSTLDEGESGNLVARENDSTITVGKWRGVILPGQDSVSLICEPNDGYESYFTDDERVERPLVSMLNGEAWKGEYIIADEAFREDNEDLVVNSSALTKIKAAIEATDFSTTATE